MKRPKNRFPRPIVQKEKSNFYALPSERWTHEEMSRVQELCFDEEDCIPVKPYNPYEFPEGLYVMAGGVSWPTFIEDEGLVGIGHVAGLHLATRTIWFFSERKFIVIAANEEYPADAPAPLKTWLEECYEQFHVTNYYYQETQTVASKFVLANMRCFPRRPRPYFSAFPWVENKTAMQTMYEYQALGRLKIPDSRLHREMLQYDADPNEFYPALISATVLVNGLDRFVNNDRLIQLTLDRYA